MLVLLVEYIFLTTFYSLYACDYSRDPKTGHSKSGFIRKPDIFDVRFSNGPLAKTIFYIEKILYL